MKGYICFCRGAKLLIVPVLAGLMECDPKKMWTFEQFFETTNSILKKRVVHVFNLAAGSLLHVYINPEQRSVDDVIDCSKNSKHTFNCTFNSSSSTVYMYNCCISDRMAKLQELIAEQTDIRAAEQYILFENVKFSDFIEPMEMARNYPQTSDTSPLFLFPSAAESLALPLVPVRECTTT